MAAAFRAELAKAHLGLVEGGKMLGAHRDLDRIRLPQAERIHRPARPGPAGTAMAIPHRLRRPGDLDLDRAAEAASLVGHGFSSCDYCVTCRNVATKQAAGYSS
jgi:hypothetical protein